MQAHSKLGGSDGARTATRTSSCMIIFIVGPMRAKKTLKLQQHVDTRDYATQRAYRHGSDERFGAGTIRSRAGNLPPIPCKHVSSLFARVRSDTVGTSIGLIIVDELHLFASEDIRRTADWCR